MCSSPVLILGHLSARTRAMTPLPPNPTPEILGEFFQQVCLEQQAGHLVVARNGYRQLLQYLPESAIVHYNLGLVYYDLRKFAAALGEFTSAQIIDEEDGDTLFNLALCYAAMGEYAEAAASYRRILIQDPGNTDCLYNLGGCYRRLGEDEGAITCYRRVLEIDGDYLSAISNLAYLCHRSGYFDEAEPLYRQLLDARPKDESARFMLDSLTGERCECAPDTYVRDVFDSYAEGFEQSLVDELGYDNPLQLLRWVGQLLGSDARFTRAIDLGCGTGLSGMAFKQVVSSLEGVDLSGQMLARADSKDIYARLYHSSITRFLGETDTRYELFIATDVFIYVGALEKLFQEAHGVATPDACFCFSTEQLDSDEGYRLQTSGRFAYSQNYIRTTAAATGWVVLGSRECKLRRERAGWLTGRLWLMRRAES